MDGQEAIKICRKCQVPKPHSDFSPAKQNKDGRHSYCRDCDNARKREKKYAMATPEAHEKKKAADRRDYEKHHAERRAAAVAQRLWSRYGITLEQYNEMWERQNGRCAICNRLGGGTNTDTLDVDHNHETGEVRGLLCRKCNMKLGYIEDREWFEAALKYLGDDPAYRDVNPFEEMAQ